MSRASGGHGWRDVDAESSITSWGQVRKGRLVVNAPPVTMVRAAADALSEEGRSRASERRVGASRDLRSLGGDSPDEPRDHNRQVELADDRLQSGREAGRRCDGDDVAEPHRGEGDGAEVL